MAESGGPCTERAWSSIGEGVGMDPRDRADAVLARAQRRSGVVTPDNMQSPMDSADTQVIPSSVVRGAEEDPDVTAKVPASVIERNDESHLSQQSPTVPLNRHTAAAQHTDPHHVAPVPAENARTQPLATQGSQPVDTADAPADMTFTGVPVTRGAANPAVAASDGGPNAADSADSAGDGSGEAAGGGFVPTTKVEPGTGTSELARRLEGL